MRPGLGHGLPLAVRSGTGTSANCAHVFTPIVPKVEAEIQKVEASWQHVPENAAVKKLVFPSFLQQRCFKQAPTSEAAASPLLDSSSLLVRLNVQRLSTAVQESGD